MKYSFYLGQKLLLKHFKEILKLVNATEPQDWDSAVVCSNYAMENIDWKPYRMQELRAPFTDKNKDKAYLLRNTRMEIGRVGRNGVQTMCVRFFSNEISGRFNTLYIPMEWLFALEFGKQNDDTVPQYRRYEVRFLV